MPFVSHTLFAYEQRDGESFQGSRRRKSRWYDANIVVPCQDAIAETRRASTRFARSEVTLTAQVEVRVYESTPAKQAYPLRLELTLAML